MLKFDYLVIGANGQDGFFVSRFLLKNNYKVLAIVRKETSNINRLKKNFQKNLTILLIKNYNKRSFQKNLSNIFFKKIFFLAGYSKIPVNQKEKQLCYEGNFSIVKNFLEFLNESKLKAKLLYVMSAELFGSIQKNKKKETSIIKPSNYYGYCKSLTLKIIKNYRKEKSMFISTVIAYNHDSFLSPENHIIKVLLKRFKNNKDKQVNIFYPNEYRNFSHIYDFIPVFKKILDKSICGDFILANNSNIKVIDLAKMINKLLYKNTYKLVLKNKKRITVSRKANNSKIISDFNYKPKFSVEKIIKRFNSYLNKEWF